MHRSSIRRSLAGASLILVSSSFAFASSMSDLSPEQQNDVRNGKKIEKFQNFSISAWPEGTFYQRVEATPEEAAAVFFDYALHKDYFPDLRASRIVKQINPSTAHVAYHMHKDLWWPLSPVDEHYVVEDHLSSYDSGRSFHIEWKMVKESSDLNDLSDSVGDVRFEPMGTATLMVYRTLVVPKRTGASLGKEGAKQSMRDATSILEARIERLHKDQPALLKGEIENLHKALEVEVKPAEAAEGSDSQ